MDKARDVFVLFFKPTADFCGRNASEYAAFAAAALEPSRAASAAAPSVLAAHMDVSVHKSPFVFEDNELPVVMLFPGYDKRPLEYDSPLSTAELERFARENGSAAKAEGGGTREDASPKSEL